VPTAGDDYDVWRMLIARLHASLTPEQVEEIAQAVRKRAGGLAPVPAFVREILTGSVNRPVALSDAGTASDALVAKAQVTKPTLMKQVAMLPCGKQLGVVVVILVVALALKLPKDDRDYVAYLLAVLAPAYALILKIIRS
jgi:hypothetical protein